jgi:lipoprotein-releasing system permease protein
MLIFIFLGLLVGTIGAGLGVAGGFTICKLIQWFPPELPGEGQIYYLKYLPCEMELWDFVGVSVYTFFVSFLASLYPAFRASKLMPVEALRFN